jgi:hypothetical protein
MFFVVVCPFKPRHFFVQVISSMLKIAGNS